MKKSSIYFLTSASLLMLSACANRDYEPVPDAGADSPRFSAYITEAASRAFDRSWERGDEIGISGAGRTNVCYVTSNGDGRFVVKSSGSQIYFQGENEVNFTAYYPWNSSADGAQTLNIDTRDQSKRKNFDFLWAQTAGKKSNPNVTFNFTHRMAKVVFTIKAGEGMTFEEIKKARFSIDGVRASGSFNINNGSISVGPATGEWNFSDCVVFDDAAQSGSCALILIPQQFASPLDFTAELDLTGNSDHLLLKADIDFSAANSASDGENARNEWVAGRQYNLTLTLNKTDIRMDNCVINPWNVVDGDQIDVE